MLLTEFLKEHRKVLKNDKKSIVLGGAKRATKLD
jgi:hypothetical protein